MLGLEAAKVWRCCRVGAREFLNDLGNFIAGLEKVMACLRRSSFVERTRDVLMM